MTDRSLVMERLWVRAGEELRVVEDTGGELVKVLGYTRHDTLYEETRPADVQVRENM